MSKLLSWLQWPKNIDRKYKPWYEILWAIPWALVAYLGLGLAFVGLLMIRGYRDAIFWIKDAYF